MTTTHTYSNATGSYDVLELQKLLENEPCEEVLIADIKGVSKSRRSGFSKHRLLKTDTTFPVILDFDNNLIDGRHRIIKLMAEESLAVLAKRATWEQLQSVKIN